MTGLTGMIEIMPVVTELTSEKLKLLKLLN